MKKLIFIAAIWMFTASYALAGGFMLPEQGAKSTGFANAFTAVADDASALWYNPAGISFQEGTVITLGADAVIPTNEFTPVGGATFGTKSQTFFIPHAYISYNPGSDVSFGIGINSPFGLTTDWVNSGAPFTSLNPLLTPPPVFAALAPATVTFSELKMVSVNPNVAYRINDEWAIAAGVMYYNAFKVNLDNQLLIQHGNGDGWGGNVALLYKGDQFNFGLTYRSSVKVNIDGTATGSSVLAPLGNTTLSTSVTFPDMVNVGVAFSPDAEKRWLISAEVDWTNWDTFDQLDLVYGPSLLTAGGLGGATTAALPQNWSATFAFRAGLQWAYNNNMRARIGYSFDPTPIDDVDFTPRIPGNDRHLFAAGWGFDFNEQTTLDLSYMYVLVNDRTQTASAAPFYNGTYNGSSHLIAASLTARF